MRLIWKRYLRYLNEQPKEGNVVIAKCPDYCSYEYSICHFGLGKFVAEDGEDISAYVEEWSYFID